MKQVLTFRAVMGAMDTSLSVMLTTFVNRISDKSWQLERELHVVSLYTGHLI
jgi:hypothetical protein